LPCPFNPSPIPSSAAAEGGLDLMFLLCLSYPESMSDLCASPPSAAAEEGMGEELNGQGSIFVVASEDAWQPV